MWGVGVPPHCSLSSLSSARPTASGVGEIRSLSTAVNLLSTWGLVFLKSLGRLHPSEPQRQQKTSWGRSTEQERGLNCFHLPKLRASEEASMGTAGLEGAAAALHLVPTHYREHKEKHSS